MTTINSEDARKYASLVHTQIVGAHAFFTTDINASSLLPPIGGTFLLENDVRVMGQQSGDQVIVTARYNVRAMTEGDDPTTVWSVQFKLIGVWDLQSDGPEFSHEELQCYALGYGVSDLHPYARETVHNLAGRLGYPGATLEILSNPFAGGIEIAEQSTFESGT